MNESAWENLVDVIDVKFGIDDHGRKTEPLEDNHELKQTVEFIEFTKSGEQFRVERVTKPAIQDRKSIGGRGMNASVRFENVYDTSQTTSKVHFFRSQAGAWQPIEPTELALG
jgi:hypothetical protein